MKYVNYALITVIGYLVVFRLVVPYLVSSNNDAAVLTGVVFGVVVVWYAIYAIVEHIKEKKEENEDSE